MKKRLTNKQNLSLFAPFMSLLLAIMLALAILAPKYSGTISLWLYGVGGNELSEDTIAEGADLVEKIVEEGTVLLKNENEALPLNKSEISKVNVFGWAAYDWMTSTFGSRFSNTSLKKIKLSPALDEAGIEYNETLYQMYKNFYSGVVSGWGSSDWHEYRGDVAVGNEQKFTLHEPGAAFYTDTVITEAKNFSSVALVVIGRTGGEAADLRHYQTKQEQKNGSSVTVRTTERSYLQLSTEEEEMIAAAKRACGKVIVLLNTSNAMELGFLDDDGIDAALLVGLTGLTGVRSVIDILRGEDENGVAVCPSGRTTDTYAYSISSAPSSVNSGYGGARKYTGLSTSNNYSKKYFDAYLDYYEGIYVGYRYYETAAYEGFIDYDATVQYPFGYGLSYTDFEWSVRKVEIDGREISYNGAAELGKDDKISIYVDVTNKGQTAGKEVVQLYYSAPYDKVNKGIEKSSVVLGAFAKTEIIAPGKTDSVVLEIDVQDMSSYDGYDANKNTHYGYELDGGEYVLSLKKNSHDTVTMAAGSRTGAEIKFTIPEAGYQYTEDKVTGEEVKNRFTGDGTIDGYSIDGKDELSEIVYLSRADFEGTFPVRVAERGRNNSAFDIAQAIAPTAGQLAATGYSEVEAPIVGSNADITIKDMFSADGYYDEDWELLIWQMSYNELIDLIRDGYFKTHGIDSIGKDEYFDLDGPLGLNTRVMSDTPCNFISYPSETLVAQTWNLDIAFSIGKSVGNEAAESGAGIKGWYGPAANIHRNPYSGRNAEYYSEDAYISGKFAAETIRGAKSEGLYCYLKHFAVNDSESLREGLFTFLTEQTLREIYLRPFELAVKEGGANALMTSMNRIGAAWAGASYSLCTEVLRGEWKFNGSLVTDWCDSGNPYMPVYKGIWAGQNLWLNNADHTPMRELESNEYRNNDVFVTLAQKSAHDVLWTLVDTAQSLEGAVRNNSWIWYVVAAEVLLAAGIGLMAFFMARNIRRNNKNAVNSDNDEEKKQ